MEQVGVQRARPWPRRIEFIEGVLIDADDDDGEPQGEGSTELKSGIKSPQLQDIEEAIMMRREHQSRQADSDEPWTMYQPVEHASPAWKALRPPHAPAVWGMESSGEGKLATSARCASAI